MDKEKIFDSIYRIKNQNLPIIIKCDDWKTPFYKQSINGTNVFYYGEIIRNIRYINFYTLFNPKVSEIYTIKHILNELNFGSPEEYGIGYHEYGRIGSEIFQQCEYIFTELEDKIILTFEF